VTAIDFALMLNLHQPEGNLEHLLDHNPWEAKEILYALDRIPRSLWAYEDCGRVHLSLSGTLLQTLTDPAFQERVYGIVDCGSLLWHLQNTRIIDVLGSAYYHPVLPLIPRDDWEEQLRRWHGIGEHLFGRGHFAGFWPPELGFSMELIPLLRRWGYRYVVIDSNHVEAATPMSWADLRYRPHIARWGDDEIIVVVRDRDLSDAQEAGMDADWFLIEVHARTRHCSGRPLVTTATDGDNGGWFRNTTPGSNFWTLFYHELLDRSRAGISGVQPVFIQDHLAFHEPFGEVTVKQGAWNTGWHHGEGFVQWTGSAEQRAALSYLAEVSGRVHHALDASNGHHPELEAARTHVLRAETSCNFYWGAAWVERAFADLDRAAELVAHAQTTVHT
jgi:4-alpha-glucanotransferase